MKSLLKLTVLFCSVGLLLTACSKTRKVEMDNLSSSFASSSAEVKANVSKASAAIKERDFATALTAIKAVVDGGDLSDDQKQALEIAVTDITVILSENPPEGSDELFDIIDELTMKLLE